MLPHNNSRDAFLSITVKIWFFQCNPIIIVLIVTIPSGIAFMMPMSTPAVAMMLSTGYLELKDTIKYGSILTITGIVLTFLSAILYWPLIA